MNGSTKVARTYQPDIVGLIGGVQVLGNIVRPIDRVTPSRTTRISTEVTEGEEGPHPFQSRASVTYLVGLRHGVPVGTENQHVRLAPDTGYTIFVSFFFSFFLLNEDLSSIFPVFSLCNYLRDTITFSLNREQNARCVKVERDELWREQITSKEIGLLQQQKSPYNHPSSLF